MHRDVKLGLALGILVIGFAVAFCFPRQPAADVAFNPAAALKLAHIDDEIRLERRRTFVGDELSPQPEPVPTAAAALPIDADLPPLQTAAMRAQAAQNPAPDPIRREVPMPLETLPAVESVAQAPVEAPVEAPAVEDTFYTVQPGDTLSAVAARTLGSSRRYEAIYEANRDLLATPDSLQIGMKLRIPQPADPLHRRQLDPVARHPLDSVPR